MTLVFTSLDFVAASLIQSMLEAEGIQTEMRNLRTSSLAGEIPVLEVLPEIWVSDPAEAERAKALIAAFRAEPTETFPEWTCRACGETVPGSFTECWKCGQKADPATGG